MITGTSFANDVGYLDQVKTAGPMLLKLYEKHKQYKKADVLKPQARSELAKTVAELFSYDSNESEFELITNILMGLVRQAEIDLRAAVSERLSTMTGIPFRMILLLAHDEIVVADPILRRSRVLEDSDLIYIVTKHSKKYWQSIAMRPNLSKELVDTLSDTNDIETAKNLIENKNVHLTEYSLDCFYKLAIVNEKLAKPLVMREEVSVELASKLYEFVGSEIKSFIRQNFDLASAKKVSRKIDDVVYDLAFVDKNKHYPSDDLIEQAEKAMRNGKLNIEFIMDTLMQNKLNDFVAYFSVYSGVPIETALEILEQDLGQGLAVISIAMDLSKANFVKLFIMTSRFRKTKVITQQILAKSLSYYDGIKYSDAKAILNESRH